MTISPERSCPAGLSPAELGGDPPCWAGMFDDHGDEPRARGSAHEPRHDLTTRAHVHDLVTAFYREIMFDELLEPVFGEVAEVDWVEHIPRLIDYWCSILLGTATYGGSVTKTHRRLHDLQPIEPEHCDRWFALWVHCVDEHYAGPNADRATRYAAALMAGLAKRVFGFTWPTVPSSTRSSTVAKQ